VVSRGLGHADERTAGVRCARCRKPRWIVVRPAGAATPVYTCQRCSAVLAGRNAADPLVTEAGRARSRAATAAKRRKKAGLTLPEAPIPPGDEARPVSEPSEAVRQRQRAPNAAGARPVETLRARVLEPER
jgi:hypothetical protein